MRITDQNLHHPRLQFRHYERNPSSRCSCKKEAIARRSFCLFCIIFNGRNHVNSTFKSGIIFGSWINLGSKKYTTSHPHHLQSHQVLSEWTVPRSLHQHLIVDIAHSLNDTLYVNSASSTPNILVSGLRANFNLNYPISFGTLCIVKTPLRERNDQPRAVAGV